MCREGALCCVSVDPWGSWRRSKTIAWGKSKSTVATALGSRSQGGDSFFHTMGGQLKEEVIIKRL